MDVDLLLATGVVYWVYWARYTLGFTWREIYVILSLGIGVGLAAAWNPQLVLDTMPTSCVSGTC